jgi:superoxide dismutase, Cu-Zn family
VRSILLLALAAAIAGCAAMRSSGPSARADLQPTKGNRAQGTATFTQMGDRVRVVADVSGLNPGQEHAFHIHEAGDCSSGDGMSTKGHFNPLSKQHAHYSTPERHAGDMPALKADANGNAHLDTTLDVMSVNPGPTSIVGKGLIVHAGADDYKTQPTGNAGARVACGVINRS